MIVACSSPMAMWWAVKPIGTGAPYSMPTTRRPVSSTIRPGWRLITVPRSDAAQRNGRSITSSSGSMSA
ncbi:MAG: hypothetical protein U0838_16420 [Chloroflexota bacterium]